MKSSLFRFLAIALVFSAAPLGAQSAKSVREGIEAWQRGDYPAAVAIWTPIAEKGDADAAFNLGQAYRLGRGVKVDLAKAQSWLGKAAAAGHLDAQTTLGLLLFDSGSRDSAMAWLKKAADRGEPRAMLVYGTALFNGDAGPRDPLLAYAYVSRAAAQGLGPAKATLAEMDAILPVETRKKGVEIALRKANKKEATAKKAQPKAAPAIKEKPNSEAVAKAQPAPPKPAPAAAAAGKWRIQLGAFSKRSSAEALFAKLSGSAPVSGHSPHYVSAGAVTRLQVGGYASKAAATAACAALSAKGQACFPVSP